MASQTTALHAAQTTPQPTRTVCARRHPRSPRGRPTARHMTRASTPTGAGGATLSAHGDPLNHKAEPPVSCPAGDRIWRTIREEAQRDSDSEALLSSFLHASILAHDSFPRALAFILAARLADATLLPSELSEIFRAALASHPSIVAAALADLAAVRERDPACSGLSQALLYYKGFHALQVQRIAHVLWHQGRRMMASALQSRSNEVFAVDIHPAARIGAGVLLDHGTGVVIGATAVIGANVSILQNVTLGGHWQGVRGPAPQDRRLRADRRFGHGAWQHPCRRGGADRGRVPGAQGGAPAHYGGRLTRQGGRQDHGPALHPDGPVERVLPQSRRRASGGRAYETRRGG
ncbi:SAT2 [Auxenochlorella protothecoides x Auxenochlorella symbiontica]